MKTYFISLILLLIPVLGYSNSLRVAVLDSGIYYGIQQSSHFCEHGHRDFTGYGLNDNIGHGTNVAGLIASNAGSTDFCMVNVKAMDPNNMSISSFNKALRYVLYIKPNVVNISAGGSDPNPEERALVKKILDAGIFIIAAAGNEATNLDNGCNYFPACYDSRVIVVGNIGNNSNYGRVVDVVVNGNDQTGFGITLSGTSQATAIMTGRIIKRMIVRKD